MAVKSRRIALRTDPESEALLVEAAAMRRESMSSFILSAALQAADLVLGRADSTLMAAAQFDALIGNLDQADTAEGLAAAAARPRRFTRR